MKMTCVFHNICIFLYCSMDAGLVHVQDSFISARSICQCFHQHSGSHFDRQVRILNKKILNRINDTVNNLKINYK